MTDNHNPVNIPGYHMPMRKNFRSTMSHLPSVTLPAAAGGSMQSGEESQNRCSGKQRRSRRRIILRRRRSLRTKLITLKGRAPLRVGRESSVNVGGEGCTFAWSAAIASRIGTTAGRVTSLQRYVLNYAQLRTDRYDHQDATKVRKHLSYQDVEEYTSKKEREERVL